MDRTFQFRAKTFTYFRGARKNAGNRAWFEANRGMYEEAVELPFAHLVNALREELGPLLPGINFSTRKISRPLLRKAKDGEGSVVRAKATAFFGETATSMFETNPGVYVSIGAGAEDNVIGCGLYEPSARQRRRLREHFGVEAEVLRSVLAERALRRRWGGLAGERYTRYPNGFEAGAAGGEYLWHKQFLLSKTLSREAVCEAGFVAETVASMVAAVPFLAWTRRVVGVYRRPVGEEGEV